MVMLEDVYAGSMAPLFSFKFVSNLVAQLCLVGIGLIKVIILMPQLVILTLMDHGLHFQMLVMAHFLQMYGQDHPHLQGLYLVSLSPLVPSLLTLDQLLMHLGFQTQASFHVTNDAKIIQQIHSSSSSVFTSTTHPHTPLTFHNLLLIPTITRNLISVSHFCHDNNVYFLFFVDTCLVHYQVTNDILLEDRVDKDGLYECLSLTLANNVL